MPQPKSLMSLSPAAFGASLAMAMMGGGSALAQSSTETTTAPAAESGPITLPQINVGGAAISPTNPMVGNTGLGRVQGPIQSIPQTISVVPQEVIQQQNATTMEQALRNVPGITSSVGEGNGGVQGDQLRIRGFNAQNDIYTDGLRDFGAYSRDLFAVEDVAVFSGASGLIFGAGSAAGAVNMNSRMAHLGNAYGGTASYGSGNLMRGTIDLNRQIGDSSAVRLNFMMQQRDDIPERDHQDGSRWGIAPSFSLGLGRDVTFSLQYLHYQYDQATDTGFPIVTQPGQVRATAPTEYGLRRANWYGIANDRDKVQLDRITARLQWKATDWLTLYNDTRLSFLDRDFAYTILSCTGTCAANFFNGVQPATYAVSGAGAPYSQYTWGGQNLTTGVARFNTGSLRHEATFGLDMWYESTDRDGYGYSPARVGGNFFSPNQAGWAYSLVPSTAANATRKTETTTFGLFASDRVWFTPEISILAGLRWNHFETDYTASGPTPPVTSLHATSTAWDPRAAVIWEPTPTQTYYISYSQSTSPPGNNFTTLPGQANFNNTQLDPETNTIYEIGAKWSVLDQRLGLTAALFRIEKGNATAPNPADPTTVIATGDKQRNQGFELGAVGRVTRDWLVSARYTFMDSEIYEVGLPANQATVGNRVQFVPRHAVALWTTYDLFRETPYNMTVGGGMTYRSDVYLNNTNTQWLPYNLSFDAMISHQISDKWRAQLNGYNLGNALNYDTLFSGRVVPSAGRTIIFQLAADY